MKLLEIKNNLVKLSYSETETPILGRFIVLVTPEKSYVAQFVNLKSDTVNNFAIAKLLFTFTSEGVVDNYDGSIPSINSEVSFLPADELLNLLPMETPIKIGNLSQQEDMLSLDVSVFERNFTVFAEKDSHKTTFISNCIRQLFQMKEKSVVVDTCNLFEDYNKIVFGKDFKLPLNSKMIDYIFEYELAEVDATTKAVIQDIFYAVQQYIKTLDYEFLPIDNFVDVVAGQYKEMQMPELALLKNKLLKYRDANVFANTKEEVFALKEKLNEKNCSIIDLKDVHESLQREILGFIHTTLQSFEKYIYFFVPLTDENSDKRLLKQFVNNNHIFTTTLVSSSYKYANELKQHAQNMLLFAPQSVNHDFAAYNTFLSKLNNDECIAFGKLTQSIPFIVDMADLELDLTRDDVLGDRYQFVPAYDPNIELVRVDEFGTQIPVKNIQPEMKDSEPTTEDDSQEELAKDEVTSTIPEIQQAPIELVEESATSVELPKLSELAVEPEVVDEVIEEVKEAVKAEDNPEIRKPVANILAAVTEVDDVFEESNLPVDELQPEENLPELTDITEDDFSDEDFNEAPANDSLSEEDLDFIEDTQMPAGDSFGSDEIVEPIEESYVEEPQDAPIYPAEPEPPVEEGEKEFVSGDSVTHPRYGRGIVEKIIKYGNKTLCSIAFENVGRRLLDPSISELTKL
ncbi:hypothetical protein IJ472_06845 [bacterium]|nr:hypothetical protein [bacterium]